ncbi:MAG: D-alanyl-D-alanine carboxypeptidase/D-alanyl-D-alanine-endopeptidase [Verrucomicrobia bacterium]|nr:D-alanyl-D-alanine carboxypeptidase/D-alanyl-D-alanine-endopeptidase [Verrucomicrobiota bacterium]
MFLTLLLSTTLLLGEGDSSWDHASVSSYAADMKSGAILLDENSGKSLMPASCMKVVTTAAALQILGPETRFQTDLEYDGTLENGTLHGNLYIRGGGDPCLGSDRINGSLDWDAQIETWADAIQKLGIQKIEGDVIEDATRWEKALAVPSWSWEDLGNYYGAGASALSFHENYYTLFFKPGKEGENATILRSDPPISSLTFQNEVKTGPADSGDGACIYGSEFSPVQYIRGTVPAGVEKFAIRGAIPDPAALCAEMLTKALQAKGMTIQHQKISPSKRTVFHTTFSPTVQEIVYWTNQKSINLYAEHLLKKIGETVFKEGSTEAGIRAVTDFWRSKKIDLAGFNMADGSGLSRKNLVTARQMVSILSEMKKSDLFPLFFESLPQVNNHVKAKDGAMSLVRGYVGYRGDVAFAILVNQCLDPQKNQKIKRFLSDANAFKR